MTELLSIGYSPWSEKARWALDVRGVPYRVRHYQPLLGEPALRWKLRRFVGRVSVPVLTTEHGRVIVDSAEIAKWADAHGEGPALFPHTLDAEITRFVDLSERALAAGRALSLERMLDDDEALAEMVPGPIRRTLGRIAPRFAAFGVKRTLRKYDGHLTAREGHRRAFVAALDEVRAALAKSPSKDRPRTLLGRFTFADIAVSQALVFIDPPATGIKLGAASRRSFSDPEMRERYSDLVAWRDDLYKAFRKA